MKPFLLVFNDGFVPRREVLNFLDTRLEVLNWSAFAQGGVFIISESSAHDLGNIVHEGFPDLYFAISEINPQLTNGWLPQAAWDFINNPRSSGRWPRLADYLAKQRR